MVRFLCAVKENEPKANCPADEKFINAGMNCCEFIFTIKKCNSSCSLQQSFIFCLREIGEEKWIKK